MNGLGAFSTASNAGRYLYFPTNGRVTIDLAGRADATNGLKVVTWVYEPCEFKAVLDDTTAANFMLVRKTDGLYLATRNDRVVETAEWTGAAGNGDVADAANWSCTGFDGAPVEGGIPGPLTTIRVAGQTSLSYSDRLVYARLLVQGPVELTADCDWGAFGHINLNTGTFIDLKGHNLRVTEYSGAHEVNGGACGFTDNP